MGVRIPLDIETRTIIGEEIAKIEGDYYKKEEVDQKIEEAIPSENLYKVTNQLPEVGEPNLLYIVPITIFTNPGDPVHPPEGRTYYWDEELQEFVLIGSFQDISELDTSDFYTKEEIDSQFIAVEEDPVFSQWQMNPNVKIGTLAQSPANTANIAIGAQSIAYTINPTGNRGVIAIGVGAEATGGSYASGEIPDTETETNGTVFSSIAIGMSAKATADDTIQLGKGINANPYTFQVGNYTLLNTVSGKIPIERLPANNEALENQPIIVLEQLVAVSLGTANYNVNLKGNTATKYQVYCNYKTENTYVVFTPDDYTTVDGTYAADDIDELFNSLTQEQIDQILPGLLEGLGVTTLDEYKALFDYTQYIIPLDPARITYGFDVLIVPYGTALDTGFRQKSLYTKQYHAGDDIQWMLTDSYGKLPDGYDGYARISQVPPYREIYRKIDIQNDTCTVSYRFAGNTENSLWLVTDLDETVVTGNNLVGSPFTDYTYSCSLEQATSEITVYFITNTDWANRANNIYWNDTFFAVSEFIKYKDRLNIVNERVGGEFRVVNDYSDQQTVAKYTTNEKTINLMDIKVGDDLSGATIHFNSNNLPIVLSSDAGLSGFQWVIWTPVGGLNFGVVWNECFIQDADMNYLYHVTETNSDPTTLYTPNWAQDAYTFPQGAVVQSIYDLNGNRQSWEDFEVAMADNSWKPSMATVDVHFPAISIGDPNDDLLLTGKAERPSYKGNDIAFVSDINTSDENPIIFETGDTMYQMSVLIPTVERPDGTLASLVDSNELTAHAAHDEQMFNDLSAAIINNQFTPEQIQSIVNQAIDAADGELVTDTELDSAIKDAKNYADNLQYRQVLQIAKEEIDWASQRTIALSKTTTDFTVNGGDSSYAGAHTETTWTADKDCYIYVKFSIYSPQAANTANLGGSNMRVFVGVDGKEAYNRAETLGNGQWAGWTWSCFRKVNEGQTVDIRSSKEQAIGYAVGSFSMQTFDIKTDALDGLDQKADKYFIDATRPQNFGDLVIGTDLSGMTIELPTLDISNPQNLAAVEQLQFTGGGKLSFVLSDDGTVTISAFDASQTGTTLYAAGTSSLVPSVPTYTFPAGSIVDTLDPTIFDVLGGDWKEQLLFPDLPEVSYKDEITIEDLYDMIGEGGSGDVTKEYVDQQDTAISDALAVDVNNLAIHRQTDTARWNDVYDFEYDSIVRDIAAKGLALTGTSQVYTSSYTESSTYGSIMKLELQNTSDTDVIEVKLTGNLIYSTAGIPAGVTIIKYMLLEYTNHITINNTTTPITILKLENDVNSSYVTKEYVDGSDMALFEQMGAYLTKSSFLNPAVGSTTASNKAILLDQTNLPYVGDYIYDSYNRAWGLVTQLDGNTVYATTVAAPSLIVTPDELSNYDTSAQVSSKIATAIAGEMTETDVTNIVNAAILKAETDGTIASEDWVEGQGYLTGVAVDGTTITGNGTVGSPLKALSNNTVTYDENGNILAGETLLGQFSDGIETWGNQSTHTSIASLDRPEVINPPQEVKQIIENLDLLPWTNRNINFKDPSPRGWRIPTNDEIVALDAAGRGNWTQSNGVNGIYFGGESNVFLPAAGYRNYSTGSVEDMSSNGRYWSSTPYNMSTGYYLPFSSIDVYPANTTNYMYGFSIRCVRDATITDFESCPAGEYQVGNTIWAKSNLSDVATFADNPEDYGAYFQWGQNTAIGGDGQSLAARHKIAFLEDVYDQIAALQTQLDQVTSDLTNHVLHDADLYQAILIAAREEAQAIYDGTDVPLSTTGTPVIGTGGVLDLGGSGQYIVPENGGITITFSAVLALGNVQVLVNGNSVFDSSALSLLSVPAPTTVRVNGGDIVTTSGSLGLLSSLSVVFYPNKPI